MFTPPNGFCRFGPYRLDLTDRVLWLGDSLVPLTPKALEILETLVEGGGRVVSKEDLMARVWPDTFVEEANLSHHVYKLREALGEQANGSSYIETVARRGYRFVARVERDEPSVPAVPDTPITPVPVAPQQTARSRMFKAAAIFAAAALIGGLLLAVGSARRATSSIPRAVAVLPFLALTSADHDEALELGMANAVITRLTNVPGLNVRPTSAVLAYRAASRDPIAAGREQQVEAVVDGKIQRSDGHVRVTVQLLQVNDGRPVWAETFDEKADGVFAIQDAISERIVSSLSIRLSGVQRNAMAQRETSDMVAYDAYLRGVYYNSTWVDGDFRKGAEYLHEAVTRDPSYARAWAALAFAYSELAFTDLSTDEAREMTKEYAHRAISLETNVIQAHQALVNAAQYYDRDWAAAERECRTLLDIAPGDARSHQMYAWFLGLMGRYDEGIVEARRAQALDPRSVEISTVAIMNRAWARRPDEALAEARRAAEIHPDADQAVWMAQMHLLAGRFTDAIAAIDASKDLTPFRLGLLGYAYARAGRKDDAKGVLGKLLEHQGRAPALEIAGVYSGLGDSEQAMAWLEKGYADRSPWLSWLKVLAPFDPLRDNPRFRAFMRKVGFAI